MERLTSLAASGILLGVIFLGSRAEAADPACDQVRYTFQPDCYHAPGDPACSQSLDRLDFGPQIAVWVETSSHVLVDTLMVTNLTAARGIGNRPGIWNFRSGPKFPYGKRWMSLPLWAFARGKLYGATLMQDDREDWMGFHESHSSKEPFFCRPVTMTEVNLDVDVITCPSAMFNSAKGKMSATAKSYYPPRNDLASTTFINQDCDTPGESQPKCATSAKQYSTMNDLDAVAAATPAYGQAYTRTWRIPANLPPGDYAIAVEVNKEYDTNATHHYAAFQDPNLQTYGIDGNFGQPSVLYRVPIRIGSATATAASTSQIAGYSRWTSGQPLDGTLLPRDTTITTDVPGSGEQRLLAINGPSGRGRLHVELTHCPIVTCDPDGGGCDPDGGDVEGGASTDGGVDGAEAPDAGFESTMPMPDECSPLPPLPTAVSGLAVESTTGISATLAFNHASANGKPVASYDIRYQEGSTMSEDEFAHANTLAPLIGLAPGTTDELFVKDLKPSVTYVVGIRSVDRCDQESPLATKSFTTTVQKFTQLSGCFIATAAYGSALEPHVAALRHARDRLKPRSPLFAAATDLYYRSGPAAAAVLGQSDVAKVLARRVLAPFAGLAEALDTVGGTVGSNRP